MIEQKIARLKETAARKVAESKASQRAVATPDRQLKLELWRFFMSDEKCNKTLIKIKKLN